MAMRALLAVAAAASLIAGVSANQPRTDLDDLMARVLARRDENWKRLQQYVLDERETFDLMGPGGVRLYGFRRDYTWFPREGVFIRSPLRVNGVSLGESERQKAEAEWTRDERRREERRRQREEREKKERQNEDREEDERSDREGSERDEAAARDQAEPGTGDKQEEDPAATAPQASATDTSAAAVLEPAFVSSAYFLRFKFEAGRYGLVGRETIDGQPVLRIEYYPAAMFNEGRTRPNRRVRDRDAEVEEKMNKVSLVTLWVDPARQQILQYTFDDIDMDFLPGRSIARVDDVKATMRMGQPFPDIWLPRDVSMQFRMLLASGPIEAAYRVEYLNYRQAGVTVKVK